MEYFKPINYARSTGKVWIESLQVLQSLPSCSDLVVLWHDMKWYEMYSMYRIKCKMAWISWMFFFFPSSVDPWRNSFSFSCCDVARHRINHHGSCPDDWYAGDTLCWRCLWAARNCNGFFLVRPKRRLVSIPKIAKICQNLGILMGFCMFLTKKQKHALCLHMDLSCKNFRIFRMGGLP